MTHESMTQFLRVFIRAKSVAFLSRFYRLLAVSLQQLLAAVGQFIRYQPGDQIDGRHGFGLGLAQRVAEA